MRHPGSALALALALGVGVTDGACAIPAFDCGDDSQCVAAVDGRCEPNHRCSYPDDECPSKRRYGEYAGDLSKTCVDDDAGSSSGVASSSSGPSSSTSTGSSTSMGSSSTTDAGTSSGTTGTNPPIPLGHWPLDEGVGLIANDIGSGAHHGAIEDGEWVETAQFGGGIGFTQAGAGIEVGADADFDLQDVAGLTLMGWCRLDTMPIPNVAIIAKFGSWGLQFWGDDAALTSQLVLYPVGVSADGDTDGPIHSDVPLVNCPGPGMSLVSPKGPDDDARLWHHYAGTYDIETRILRSYIDGVEVCVVDANIEMLDGTLEVTTTGVQLGRWQSSGPTMLGAIDDVRIYDEVLGADDIALIASERR